MSSEVRKAMTILYKVHNGLYVNLTNRCPCACTFCERQTRDHVSEVNDAPLWLEHEPTVEEVKAELDEQGIAYGEPKQGIMIETPAAVSYTHLTLPTIRLV